MRFRPIMMTTFAALFGALPLAFGTGEGSELRHPLGITIVGGLIVSQALTLYTTPVVFLYLDNFGKWLRGCGAAIMCARAPRRWRARAEAPLRTWSNEQPACARLRSLGETRPLRQQRTSARRSAARRLGVDEEGRFLDGDVEC